MESKSKPIPSVEENNLMPQNTRKLQRRHLIYYLPVVNTLTGVTLGRIADITREGILLLSEAPLETDQIIPVKITLPDEIEGEREIFFTAKSIWCHKDKNPDVYGVGFQMIDASEHTAEQIENLIEFLGFND